MSSFFVVSLLTIVFIAESKPVFIEIAPGGEECYYEAYEKDETIEFLYVIKRGGSHDIELKVYTPYDSVLVQKVGTKYVVSQHCALNAMFS